MLVSLIIGSENDRNIGDIIYKLLKDFGINVEYRILSAHKNPEMLTEYIKSCKAEVFIAVAGLSAALPGFIASYTLKPVIGVPRNVNLEGIDALLSIVQMPPGIPVACVGIDNSENAALLAIEILSLKYPELRNKLAEYRKQKAESSYKIIES
jgi:5-(carboxyamino)imidazole ribonucleotide mutase